MCFYSWTQWCRKIVRKCIHSSSTLIGVLTGRVDITKGDAFLFGHSIRKNLEEIKNFMGLCAQDNIVCKKFKI
jgi:ABC-type multidrug transport system ATPase subunit